MSEIQPFAWSLVVLAMDISHGYCFNGLLLSLSLGFCSDTSAVFAKGEARIILTVHESDQIMPLFKRLLIAFHYFQKRTQNLHWTHSVFPLAPASCITSSLPPTLDPPHWLWLSHARLLDILEQTFCPENLCLLPRVHLPPLPDI